VDEENEPVVLTLNDVQTLRLTVLEGEGDAGLNFLVFVPVPRIATPLVTDLHPASNATNAAPDTIVSLRIENRETSLVASSLMLILDETDVTADVLLEPDSGGTTVTYQPPELLLPGTTHVARIEFQDDASPPHFISRTWSFVIPDLPVLPALFAAPSDTVLNPGFRGRIHKARNDAPAEIFVGANNSSNTAARAELQLAGLLIDPGTGEPFVNEAAGPVGDGSFSLVETVNFQQDGTSGGLFGGDMPFPNVPPGDPDFMAMEILTYLDLDPGVHRFGVAARDGFQLTSGPRPNVPDLLIARSDAEPTETALPFEAEFEFEVTESGIYPFRLLWWEGQGDAELEW
jgi:hypothetical protein